MKEKEIKDRAVMAEIWSEQDCIEGFRSNTRYVT